MAETGVGGGGFTGGGGGSAGTGAVGARGGEEAGSWITFDQHATTLWNAKGREMAARAGKRLIA